MRLNSLKMPALLQARLNRRIADSVASFSPTETCANRKTLINYL
tara:strand:+ start:979 stop:1110 length:132 start_codon:yes stop_codon:yes gene_type:complete